MCFIWVPAGTLVKAAMAQFANRRRGITHAREKVQILMSFRAGNKLLHFKML